MTQTISFADTSSAARLGQTHGYRIDGELAWLNAELAIDASADDLNQVRAQNWALQLWACESPYRGGPLSGIKVAEAALDLSVQPQQAYAEAFARLPAGGRDYSMVLVLASGAAGTFDHVHDFANYPQREQFAVPHFVGDVTYDVAADSVTLRASGIRNPRSIDNLSGTLALELWALDVPYTGEQFSGEPLAGVELGTLGGDDSFYDLERQAAYTEAPAGYPERVLMLREWTSAGYVTRDFRSFSSVVTRAVERAASPVEEARSAVRAAEPEAVRPAAAAVEPAAARPSAAAVEPAAARPSAAAVEPAAARPAATVVAAAAATQPAAAVRAVKATAAQPAVISVDVPAAIVARSTDVAASRVSVEPATARLVSINTASLDDLAKVEGLNRKLAAEIIKARPFRQFEDLTRVRGVGDKTLRRLRSVLSL
jgi:competence ComEA-like helix-hairpin-helix protein